MRMRARLFLAGLFDIGEAKTTFGRALLRERYRALQRQVPLLYAIAFVNFLGLVFASGAEAFRLTHPANFLIVLLAVRFVHWTRASGIQLPPSRILKELKRTLLLAGLI